MLGHQFAKIKYKKLDHLSGKQDCTKNPLILQNFKDINTKIPILPSNISC